MFVRLGVRAALIVLFAAAGCSKKSTLPKTFPVHGKVVFQDGQPVTAGIVRFLPRIDFATVNDVFSAVGNIQPDGTFTLSTFKPDVKAAGAVVGEHHVVVEPESAAPPVSQPSSQPLAASSSSAMFPRVEYPDLYTVKPGDNEFTLKVPYPHPQ